MLKATVVTWTAMLTCNLNVNVTVWAFLMERISAVLSNPRAIRNTADSRLPLGSCFKMQGEKRGTVVATIIELLVITVANFFKSIRTRVQKTALETSAIATDR